MKIKVEGLAELDKAIAELKKATGKSAVRKALRESLEPLRAGIEATAPVDTGLLEDGIIISARKKSGRSKKAKAEGRNNVTLYVGPSSKVTVRAQMAEFGNANQPATPFIRPEWDSKGPGIPALFAEKLRPILAKAVKSSRKRAAKGK